MRIKSRGYGASSGGLGTGGGARPRVLPISMCCSGGNSNGSFSSFCTALPWVLVLLLSCALLLVLLNGKGGSDASLVMQCAPGCSSLAELAEAAAGKDALNGTAAADVASEEQSQASAGDGAETAAAVAAEVDADAAARATDGGDVAAAECKCEPPSSVISGCHALVGQMARQALQNPSPEYLNEAFPSIESELARQTGSDKMSEHNYGHMYAEYLDALRLQGEVNLMEIGLNKGASLIAWKNFFKSGRIYGVDYVDMKQYENERVRIFMGDQADVSFLQGMVSEIKKEVKELDFIIDDGGHEMHQQKISFAELFPLVKPGGFYFIEDLQTSYCERGGCDVYRGGGQVGMKGTAIDMIKSMIDVLNKKYISDRAFAESFIVSPVDALVGSIQCWRNMCVLRRKFTDHEF